MTRKKRNLTEMNKLDDWLRENGYLRTRKDSDDDWNYWGYGLDLHQIIVFKPDGSRWFDVICNRSSYGADEGLLEGMGEIFGEDVEGWLTADDVIERIKKAEESQ